MVQRYVFLNIYLPCQRLGQRRSWFLDSVTHQGPCQRLGPGKVRVVAQPRGIGLLSAAVAGLTEPLGRAVQPKPLGRAGHPGGRESTLKDAS